MTDRIKATFDIVTPMFLGGAHQKQSELRPPAVKGALRFWWRAMSWGQCWEDAGEDEVQALQVLHSREAEIFGSASSEHGGGQSCFRLRVDGPQVKQPPEASLGHVYLLGLGLYDHTKGCTRETAIPPGERPLTVGLRFRRKTPADQRDQVARALMLWGLLGGLGSRSRRGLGSIALHKLEGSDLKVPEDVATLKRALDELLPRPPKPLPPFTAFSSKSRVDCSGEGKDAWRLLNAVGFEMMLERSWGNKGRVGKQDAERNFKEDHDNALAVAAGRLPKDLPKRIIYGLPHNYYFSTAGRKASFDPDPDVDGTKRRRASPLLIHIHRFPDKNCAAIQSLLPASFLPSGVDVQMSSRPLGKRSKAFAPDWNVIHKYLDRFDASTEFHAYRRLLP